MKLTGWYQGDQKPVRKGYYEREYQPNNNYFSYWNGKAFSVSEITAYLPKKIRFIDSQYQNLPWRGVEK